MLTFKRSRSPYLVEKQRHRLGAMSSVLLILIVSAPMRCLSHSLEAAAGSRVLLSSLTDSEAFKVAMIALGSFCGLLLAICGCAIIRSCCANRKRDEVRDDKGENVSIAKAKSAAPGEEVDLRAVKSGPPGPIAPGILLTPAIPQKFKCAMSPPGAAAVERLVLISSAVEDPMKIAGAVLPNVAYMVYDWRSFTFQELLGKIKKTLAGQRVASIAVLAPCKEKGCVGLLEGKVTTAKTLASDPELAQFWKCVTAHLFPVIPNHPCRMDLMGCGVMDEPTGAALLLRALHKLTETPFCAADNALNGYTLSGYQDDASGTPQLIQSQIKAMDLYFHSKLMLAPSAPVAEVVLADGGDAGVGLKANVADVNRGEGKPAAGATGPAHVNPPADSVRSSGTLEPIGLIK